MKRTLFIIALLAPTIVSAQVPYDLRFVPQIDGDLYLVTVQIKSATSTPLGASNFVFVYNDEALDFTPVDGATYTFLNFDDDVDDTYLDATVTKTIRPGPDRLSLNIELISDDQGTEISPTFMDVAQLVFSIVDPTAESDMLWESEFTEAFDGGNAVLLGRGELYDDTSTLPVELSNFTAALDREAVRLQWQTASETNNAGFEVQHAPSVAPSGRSALQWSTLGLVEGAGTTTEPQSYTYRVEHLDPGPHVFRLKQLDTDGTHAYSAEVEVTVALAAPLVVEPAYPNPLTNTATLQFGVREAQQARVELFDLLGRRVAVLYNGTPDANHMHPLTIDGTRLASGLYLLRVVTDQGERALQKVTVVR